MWFPNFTSLEDFFGVKRLVSLFNLTQISEERCGKMAGGNGNDGSYTTNGSNSAILGALGTLIGYVGTEISVNDLFERLLWPQRHYNSPPLHAMWRMAFLMPMGAPLHKAALRALDELYEKGLFKGSRRGHMLGTAFFRDTGRSYSAHEGKIAPATEHVRNGMWVRAIDEMPGLLKDTVSAKPQHEDAVPLTRSVRQQISVSHLSLSRFNASPSKPVIKENTHAVDASTILCLIITEITGIAIAFVVAVVWRSGFMILWLLPLLLKLLSACFPIPRDGLAVGFKPTSAQAQDRIVKYEIIPNGNGFQVIEGEESLVVQFFRHYGHPIRSRGREVLQMTIVTCFGLLFPVGLICSLLWMPAGMQTVWLSYQLYTTIALHIYHFAGGHHWATTEEKISRAFRDAEAKHEDAQIIFGSDPEKRIHVKLVRTSHDSFADGRVHVSRLLSESCYEKQNSPESTPSFSRASSGSVPPDTALLPQKTSETVVTTLDQISSKNKKP